MNAAEFSELSASEQAHFFRCEKCGEFVDKRQLDEVLYHETDHRPRPDIQYGGSERLR
jgi:hypothetical protein